MSMRQRQQYRPPPTTLGEGRFELVRAIGSGGMAAVYKVLDHENETFRAVKVLNEVGAARTKTRTRFLTEARTMSRLNHRNILKIYEIGEEDGWYYFVMELAESGSLAARMRRLGTFDLHRSLVYTFEALCGLQHAHSHEVIHRDIKPHNILLSSEDQVKLSDFGIARVLSDAGMRITGTGDMLGSIAYMAPEQRMDPRAVGPQADIYGIGATLYIMVTGRRPIDLALSKIDPSVLERVPNEIRGILRKAIAHRPEDRFHSARAMAQQIAGVLESLDSCSAEDRMDAFDAS